MGFFTEDELASLTIVKMNFQVVGDDDFVARERMHEVEHSEFFLERILAVDVSPVFKFSEDSMTKATLEEIASRSRQFATGATALARDFHRLHRGGQTGRGAFFCFELASGNADTKLYAMLKYDYSEVLTPRRIGSQDSRQLRRIVEAFVKDKRSLQKSALFRIVNGRAEASIAAKDRAARSPDITGFYSNFLGVARERDDVELNKAVSDAILDVLKSSPAETWPEGKAVARAKAVEILRNSHEINDDTIVNAIFVAAGRPVDEDVTEELKDLTMGALRKRKIAGLEFPPNLEILKAAAKRKIRTKEKISIEYPESLQDVRVTTVRRPDGSATITIVTDKIESEEVVPETISALRRPTDDQA
ncbi:nucleoid-associated protein [Xanthomonas sacchari]|uniref:nucleoid-associated protein n=1 Tax=Xanthomonas sacchari TaxID=56458 RepID=UPI003B21E71A